VYFSGLLPASSPPRILDSATLDIPHSEKGFLCSAGHGERVIRTSGSCRRHRCVESTLPPRAESSVTSCSVIKCCTGYGYRNLETIIPTLLPLDLGGARVGWLTWEIGRFITLIDLAKCILTGAVSSDFLIRFLGFENYALLLFIGADVCKYFLLPNF
jgi:hypothetical protein